MNSFFRNAFLSLISVLVPAGFIFAQELEPFANLVDSLGNIVDAAIPVASGLALLAFFFGLAKYIFQAGDEDAQDQGKEIMFAGIIGLFLIAAIGGIVSLLESAFGVEGNDTIDPPTIGS